MPNSKLVASAIGVFVAIGLHTTDAHANARICRQLQQELREVSQASSPRQHISLRRELDKAERQLRRAGCTGFRLIFRSRGMRQCQALRANVDRLRQQVRSSRSHRSPDRRLREIERAMRVHGCANEPLRAERSQPQAGYRTLCVRKCDGYYFPISFGVSKEQFNRDQAACASFYRDGEAEVYVQPLGSIDETGDMRSLSGDRYEDQAFAFAYRQAYKPACAAKLQAGVEDLDGRKRRGPVRVDLSAVIPVPVPRPSVPDSPTTAGDVANDIAVAEPRRDDMVRTVGPEPIYVTAASEDEAAQPEADRSRQVASDTTGSDRPWLIRMISDILSLSARADESDGAASDR